MNKRWWFVVAIIIIIFSFGCTFNNTKGIKERMQPVDLYEADGAKPLNLKLRSNCRTIPTVNIFNIETREGDYIIFNPWVSKHTVNPKELTTSFVAYLKYGFEKSQVKIDSNSSKIINVSFYNAKIVRSIWTLGGEIKIKVDVPEIEYSKIFEATDWTMGDFLTPLALASHVVTRQIIDDPVIQDYILCNTEYVHSIDDRKQKDRIVSKSLSEKLHELQTAFDAGLISKDEYQRMRQRLLKKY